ncbi:MAG TPA: prolyl oligopeptidase family serine peptidase, partial [Chitinophagaceae bacterium]|nr:prolyl oligopeptidase family serine peptidase [Chitinophagaceae bacterium]
MKRLVIVFIWLIPAVIHAQLKYPVAKKETITDDYNGTRVEDPYRWLEDDKSEETKAWVQEENKVTFDYLLNIPYRDKIKIRLEEMWNYPKYSAPFQKGDFYYFTKNDGLQNQAVWYKQKGLTGKPEVFIDPNKLSEDGTVSLGGINFSRDGKFAAYTIQKSGSDWEEGYVMDVATKKLLTDKLNWLKFTGFSWKGDEGFYYSRYPEPKDSDALKGKNINQQVYYHKIGTSQSEDEMIFEDKDHTQRFGGIGLTEDERFLIRGASEGTSGGEIWVWDTKDPSQKSFSLLVPGFTTQPSIVDNAGEKLLLQTNDGAPNYKVVLVDPKNPGKENWKTIIPEQKEVLESVGTGGGFLFASYLKDASTKVYQYSYDGKLIREIKLPGIGSAGGFGTEKKYSQFFYTYTSFNYPPTIFKYDIKTGQSSMFRKTEVKFNPDDYEVKLVFSPSKDGTKVPVFLTYKKGLLLNGNNPTLMYGYGGFNIPLTPAFNPSVIFFLEQGGVYASVCMRGGSEYGEDWHKAGMLDKKQNVFDDFIGAGEWLIKNKYTNSGKLAIQGGSNGGLLIGACMTQRPELFKVAIPQVGVMDMLRYHKFTIGYAWSVEYGSSDHPDQFNYLYKYSPLHNLRPGVKYPATFVTTADHDDRV